MSLYESFDFSERVIEVEKITFSFERLCGRIFLTSLEEQFFADFFPGVFFSQAKEKIQGKNPAETQSVKTKIKSGEIPVRKNFGKVMENIDSCRLTPKHVIHYLLMLSNTQNSIIIKRFEGEKI